MSTRPSDPIDVDAPPPSSPQITTQDIHEIPEEDDQEMQDEAPPPRGRLRYKSWRKKYRKMRLKFDDMMDETNALFIAEHKAWNTARRIQEEIDQIQEILLEMNEDPKIPPHLRWDLRLPDDPDLLHLIQPSTSIPASAPPPRSLAKLYTRIVHTDPSTFSTTPPLSTDLLLPPDLLDLDPFNTFTSTGTPPAFLTTEHETAYLTHLDTQLANTPNFSHLHALSAGNLPPGIESVAPPTSTLTRSRPLPTEKDFATKCPVSVHAWLKRNQPQVFESTALDGKGPRRGDRGGAGTHGHEAGMDSEIEAPGSSHGGKARKSLGAKAAANVKLEEERSRQDAAFDEENELDSNEGSNASGRRKGRAVEGEESYRPKGGKSSGKRKRVPGDLGSGAGEVKKARKSGFGEEVEGGGET